MTDTIKSLLTRWKTDRTVNENIIHWQTTPAQPAVTVPFPAEVDPRLVEAYRHSGITSLYYHQLQIWEGVLHSRVVVSATATASGKTLGYNLPVIDRIMKNPKASALYLFPTKALGADQVAKLGELSGLLRRVCGYPVFQAGAYDGDTSSAARRVIRDDANILLTNPDMLHLGIMPHHTNWERFFRHLEFVVIDEVHTYRGVFGSHFANVIRRLKRIAKFYGSNPQFILTSATIANPREHAQRLLDEDDVELVTADFAPHGERHFILYNPPIINKELGVRAPASQEAIRLAEDLFRQKVQGILFSRTRRGVEIVLHQMKLKLGDTLNEFRAYRSGYLANERREIEAGLRQGETRLVVATSALELGIDIGSLDAALLIGYPGTISSTLQQAGRAGRSTQSSLAVFVASAEPLDQFIVKHPEYLFAGNPEHVYIDPDNLMILLNHLRSAAFELPFRPNEKFGSLSADLLSGLLELMVQSSELVKRNGIYYWLKEDYPSAGISLRSSSNSTISLQLEEENRMHTIGEVDELSSYWMVHPGAVYMHDGEMFYVEQFDLQKKVVALSRFRGDYFTQAVKHTEISLVNDQKTRPVSVIKLHYGEISVLSQVVGYKRMRWSTREIVDVQDVTMPEQNLRTVGVWFGIPEEVTELLRQKNQWSNAENDYGPTWGALRKLVLRRDEFRCRLCGTKDNGQGLHVHHKIPFRRFDSPEQANQLENLITLCPTCHREAEVNLKMKSGLGGLCYVLHGIAPLHLMCDSGDVETTYEPESNLVAGDESVVVFFEMIAGGVGLAEAFYHQAEKIFRDAQELVMNCECADGCPSCVGPAGENGIGSKSETLALLNIICGDNELHGIA
jgi:DEAD/DEAH box helicase domain-containing protein